MKTYKFYVIAKSSWVNYRWKPVAGPFPTRPAAEEAREAYEMAHATTDVAHQLRTRVVSRTKLTRQYGYRVGAEGDADIAREIAEAREAI